MDIKNRELTLKERVIETQIEAAKAMENFLNALVDADMSDFALRTAPFIGSAKFFTLTTGEERFQVLPNLIE